MTPLSLFVDGIAWWTPDWHDWSALRGALRGELALPTVGSKAPERLLQSPLPSLLTPAERRRAPTTVALAMEVATAAAAMSGLNPADLPSVFTSTHGDLAINDAMCRTLVEAPLTVSPTKFINSVHNAPAGYWAIATGCRRSSSAVSAFDHSFAAGFFEAGLQAVADDTAVLLVGYDMAATGPLACVAASRGPMAVALVLSPRRNVNSLCGLTASLQPTSRAAPTRWRSAASAALANHGMNACLPLMEALAACSEAGQINTPLDTVVMPLSSSQALHVQLQPCHHNPALP